MKEQLLEELRAILNARDEAKIKLVEYETFIAKANIEVSLLERKISEEKRKSSPVTDHAIIRFMERVEQSPVDDIRYALAALLESVDYASGNYRFDADIDIVTKCILNPEGDFLAIVRGGQISTIFTSTMTIEDD